MNESSDHQKLWVREAHLLVLIYLMAFWKDPRLDQNAIGIQHFGTRCKCWNNKLDTDTTWFFHLCPEKKNTPWYCGSISTGKALLAPSEAPYVNICQYWSGSNKLRPDIWRDSLNTCTAIEAKDNKLSEKTHLSLDCFHKISSRLSAFDMCLYLGKLEQTVKVLW